MRNLKRVLSLALALVMMLGMMIVTTSAAADTTTAGAKSYEDFTDKDEIQNSEAVATLVSLGVINGRDNGTFDPNGIVTRAEMAKMIAVCLNGGKDPLLGAVSSASPFTDTKGHWAENYIVYCANLGIVAGRGDGTFDPDATVTGTEAAKMFLTALGYRADVENLTGSSWAINTDTLANKVGLYDKLSVNVSAGLTRDNTAQLIYNGVQAYEVTYRNLEGQYDNIIYADNYRLMLTNRFGVVKAEGVLVANSKMALTGAVTKEGYCRTYDGSNYNTFKVEASDDLIGQDVVIYVKYTGDTLSPNATYTEILGDPILTNDNTVYTTTKNLKDADAVKSALRGAGLALPSGGSATAVLYTDGTPGAGTATGIGLGNGTVQKFIDNDGDGIVNYIIQTKSVLDNVKTVNTAGETITFNGAGALDFADVVGYEDLAKGDHVLLVQYDDGKYYPAEPTVVTAEVTAYTPNAANPAMTSITADGAKYSLASGRNKTSDASNAALANTMIGNTYDLYLDASGNILAYKQVSAAVSNYAVVLGASVTGNSAMGHDAKVKLLLADGSQKVFSVDLANTSVKLAGTAITASPSAKEAAIVGSGNAYFNTATSGGAAGSTLANLLVSYTLDEDNVVTLANPSNVNAKYTKSDVTASQTLTKNTPVINFTSGTIVADENTVFFIKNSDNSYSVVTGLSKLPAAGIAMTASAGQSIYFTATAGAANTAKAVYVTISSNYASSASYAYISGGYTQTDNGGSPIFTYPVVFEDGTAGTLSSKSNNGVKNSVMKYTLDSKGYATFTTDSYTKVGSRVSYLEGLTVSLANVDTDAYYASFVTDASSVIWNVSDTKNIYASEITENDVVAIITDATTGAIKTAFIYDTMLGEMTANVALTATKGQNTVALAAPAAGQKVTVKFYDASAGTTTTLAKDATAANASLAVVDGGGNSVTIAAGDVFTVIISQDNKDTRTMTYAIQSTVTYTITSSQATLHTDAACTEALGASTVNLDVGDVIYVKAATVNQALAISTLTNLETSDLVEVTAPAAGVYAIYKIVVPAADITFTVGNA